jgi:hypothetical protein
MVSKKFVTKSKEVETGSNPAESSKESYGLKRVNLRMMMVISNTIFPATAIKIVTSDTL